MEMEFYHRPHPLVRDESKITDKCAVCIRLRRQHGEFLTVNVALTRTSRVALTAGPVPPAPQRGLVLPVDARRVLADEPNESRRVILAHLNVGLYPAWVLFGAGLAWYTWVYHMTCGNVGMSH